MRIADQPMSAPMQRAARARPLLLTFIAAVVLSASLLFMVQPMFTKLRLSRVKALIQLKIRLDGVALVSA